jgi:alanine-synthesizing transaminase
LLIEDENWTPDFDDLRKNITPKTRCIIIVNPDNPTGTLHDEKVLKKIVDIAGEYKLPVVGDELYNHLVYDGRKSTSAACLEGDVPTLTFNALTKNYMMPGYRIGWICLHDSKSLMSEYKEKLTTYLRWPSQPISTPTAISAIMVLKKPNETGKTLVKGLQKRRDYACKRINEINGLSIVKPQGAQYLFPKIEGIGTIWKNDTEFSVQLVKETQIITRPGIIFGERAGPGHFRIPMSCPIEEFEEGFNRFESYLKKHM